MAEFFPKTLTLSWLLYYVPQNSLSKGLRDDLLSLQRQTKLMVVFQFPVLTPEGAKLVS